MQVFSEETGLTGELRAPTSTEIISNLHLYLSKATQDAQPYTCFTLKVGKLKPPKKSKRSQTTAEITSWEPATMKDLREDEEFQRQHGLLKEGEAERCTVCLSNFEASDEGQIVRLGRCSSHFFHSDCIEQCRGDKDFVKCPNCGIIYGVMTGDMPEGSMTVTVHNQATMFCEGSEDVGTIEIFYQFFNGRLTGGRNYRGTRRQAFLPNNPEGREVLALLIISFERRLTFTVGTSVTTGRDDVVVWNGIHHKTALDGGCAYFGYPDPTYFFRVKEELAAKGVYNLPEDP